MGVLNFPDTTDKPGDGSFTYEGDNNVLYTWDGEKWVANSDNSLIADLQTVTDNGNTTDNDIQITKNFNADYVFRARNTNNTNPHGILIDLRDAPAADNFPALKIKGSGNNYFI